MQVTTTNSRCCYHDEYHVTLNDIITSAGNKYIVPERKMGHIVSPSSFLSQSLHPHCPITEETFIDRKVLSHSHPQTDKFIPHFNGTCSSDSVLRKRSNENKTTSVVNGIEIDRTRSKSYQY